MNLLFTGWTCVRLRSDSLKLEKDILDRYTSDFSGSLNSASRTSRLAQRNFNKIPINCGQEAEPRGDLKAQVFGQLVEPCFFDFPKSQPRVEEPSS